MSTVITYDNFNEYLKDHKHLLDHPVYADLRLCKWNKGRIDFTSDGQFFGWKSLFQTLKQGKIKSWNSTGSAESAFRTHFIKPGNVANFPDEFLEIAGEQFVSVKWLEVACHALAKGYGTLFYRGKPEWDASLGEGWWYLIYIPGLDAFKWGKADENPESGTRFTGYISELNKHAAGKDGFYILAYGKVRNCSNAENVTGEAARKKGWKTIPNANEYYHIPLLEGETKEDRATRVFNVLADAISLSEVESGRVFDKSCRVFGWAENHRLPKK